MLQRLSGKKSLSLSVRISILLVFTAVLPLIIAVASSELLSRPQLIAQASTEMESDAHTRISLIDAYLIERIQDSETLGKSTIVQDYLAGNKADAQGAKDGLATWRQLNSNYDTWSLLDPQQGKPLLSYPTDPRLHGNFYIAPDTLTQLQQTNKSLLSDVSFDAGLNQAFIDIYTPIYGYGSHLLGVIRTTLSIYHIWDLVNREAAERGNQSFACIVDQNGVRIAYTTPQTNTTYNFSASNPTGYSRPAELFTAIAPLAPNVQQRIHDQNLYGNDSKAVSVLPDPGLTDKLRQAAQSSTFALTPTHKTAQFQVAAYKSSVLPWTFLVFSPLAIVTAIANQQLFYAVLIAASVLVLAALIGLGFGRLIAVPIMNSVVALSSNSQSLKTLAQREQSTATEQRWMIESSQVGLQSVRYYTKATNIAAHKLTDVSTQLLSRWQLLDAPTISRHLDEILATSKYIENAANRQEESSKNLATAIHVTTQVTEQLADGAASATDASHQLEQVVNQLRNVVGK